MKLSLLIMTVLLISPASAQEKAVMSGTVKQDQDLTVMYGQLESLIAQITATEREITRRLNCQKNMQVSTALGCAPLPGLSAAILGKI